MYHYYYLDMAGPRLKFLSTFLNSGSTASWRYCLTREPKRRLVFNEGDVC